MFDEIWLYSNADSDNDDSLSADSRDEVNQETVQPYRFEPVIGLNDSSDDEEDIQINGLPDLDEQQLQQHLLDLSRKVKYTTFSMLFLSHKCVVVSC
jgi:hypothetical protein